MKIKISNLETLIKKSLKNYGYNPKEIKIIKDILMYAQLRGNNQGAIKLIGKGLPKDQSAGEILVEKDTKLSTLLNGNKNMGMVVTKNAMERVLKKVKKHGFGMVGSFNTCSSTGAIGYYANEIAKQGYIGFVFAGSPETVNTHGSYEPLFGTNPLAIGIPTTSEPVVFDMATSAMAYFGLIEAKTAGKLIPEGIAYDNEGNITTDPAKAMDGAIRPFDKSYKGAGLSMMVEILTGPLVKAAFVGIGDSNNWGNLIFAIDPELLTNREEFKKQMTQMVNKIKSAKRLPGVTEIYVPGERGNILNNNRISEGEIEIEDNLLTKLREVAK